MGRDELRLLVGSGSPFGDGRSKGIQRPTWIETPAPEQHQQIRWLTSEPNEGTPGEFTNEAAEGCIRPIAEDGAEGSAHLPEPTVHKPVPKGRDPLGRHGSSGSHALHEDQPELTVWSPYVRQEQVRHNPRIGRQTDAMELRRVLVCQPSSGLSNHQHDWSTQELRGEQLDVALSSGVLGPTARMRELPSGKCTRAPASEVACCRIKAIRARAAGVRCRACHDATASRSSSLLSSGSNRSAAPRGEAAPGHRSPVIAALVVTGRPAVGTRARCPISPPRSWS